MELLAVRPDDGDLLRQKLLYICAAGSLEDLARKLAPKNVHFALFIAMDAGAVDDDSILRAATTLLDKGLACLCAWGPDCERVHDLFDTAAEDINSRLSGDDVILTSWHPSESLQRALWFFVEAEGVTAKFETSCTEWIIAPISNTKWEKAIRRKIVQMARGYAD